MANLLDNVVLGLRAQQMAVQDSIVFLFQQFAAQEVDERSVWHGNFSP
jgi:sorbitol-specific phosphotransferase system component IIA